MPHSSGGGSHRGGSHSGGHGGRSHHSGGSSSGGGVRNYGPGYRYGRPIHVHDYYFTGARRYVKYYANKPHYLYADYDINDNRPRRKELVKLYFGIVMLVISIFLFLSVKAAPDKIKTTFPDGGVEDRIGVMNDSEKELVNVTLRKFRDQTGITPYILTVYNETWETRYNSLENYAYDVYVNKWEDETHWLIVYSEPKNKDLEFNDWYFEGMQGNDTDEIIDSRLASEFTETLNKELTAASKHTVAEAFTDAFKVAIEEAKRPRYTRSGQIRFVKGVGVLVVALVLIIPAAPVLKKDKKYVGYIECPTTVTVKEEVCDYCRGIFVRGTVLTCPHCGGPIPPEDKTLLDKYKITKEENNEK